MTDCVLICGHPSSGNRMIHEMIQHHGVFSRIVHYGEFSPCYKCAIWPVREPQFVEHGWNKMRFPNREFQTFTESLAEHFTKTSCRLATLGVPLMIVSYEDIMRDWLWQGRRIAEFCGAEWNGWPKSIVDGNAKYRDQSKEAVDGRSQSQTLVPSDDDIHQLERGVERHTGSGDGR